MTKSELIMRLAERNEHLLKREAERIVLIIFDEIGAALERGDRVELRGFGTFSVKRRPPRIGRNPRTGETMHIEEKHSPFFKTGKQLTLSPIPCRKRWACIYSTMAAGRTA